jgi:hypothetical protein
MSLLLVLGLITLKTEALRYSEMLLSIYWSTQRNIQEYMNLHQERRAHIKSRISYSLDILSYDRLISTGLHKSSV